MYLSTYSIFFYVYVLWRCFCISFYFLSSLLTKIIL